MKRIITKHNSKILKVDPVDPPPCSCVPGQCPVQGQCESTGLIYQATVTSQGDKVDRYVGLTARSFKARHKEHYRNFENRNVKNSTSLSRKIWYLQDRNLNFEIKWKILQMSKPYQAGSRQCYLCLSEIFYIIFKPEEATLNDKSEMMGKCRHSNKFKLNKN